MKILKIELQNINSLKSDTPIVVDFEMDQFKDVGLYAITGPTGAGKTTILDAICIALYHQVPRFNSSYIKAGLEDVVSYGATDAMSRVTFENKGQRYESHWSMRLATKTGKKLTQAKEEVRLKNITSKTILAEKKREVQIEVERVTQLNYNQFLRSVMLAQGEFASFLSASAKDKGTLLEQITGEVIYKAIGDVITQRLADERKKLETIRAKINNEDLLTQEQREDLTKEQVLNLQTIKQLNTQLSVIEKQCAWYQKMQILDVENKHILTQLNTLAESKNENQPIVRQLKENERAEPFKEIFKDLTRINHQLHIKDETLKQLKNDIALLLPKIEAGSQQEKIYQSKMAEEEESFKQWLPKLENVSKLDTKIESLTSEKQKSYQLSEQLKRNIASFQKDLDFHSKMSTDKKRDLAIIAEFIQANTSIPEIEKHFNRWSTDLTQLKSTKESILADLNHLKSSEKEKVKTDSSLHSLIDQEQIKSKQLTVINSELTELGKQLSEKSLEQLLLQKDRLEQIQANWNTLKSLSENTIRLSTQKDDLIKGKQALDTLHTDLKNNKTKLKEKLNHAKTAVLDAEVIVRLETSIKSFEEERQKLEEGKACSLCGSTTHPFVEKYKHLEISKSQQTLDQRQKIVEVLIEQNILNETQLSKTSTQIEHCIKQLSEREAEINDNTKKAEQLKLPCSIRDILCINTHLLSIEKELLAVGSDISHINILQRQKDEKELQRNKTQAELNHFKTDIATFTEKSKNISEQLALRQATLQSNERIASKLENELEHSLKAVELIVPEPENTSRFIQDLEKKIQIYNAQNKSLGLLKNDISEINIKLGNLQSQLKEKKKEHLISSQSLKDHEQSLQKLKSERYQLLPRELSTEEKRLRLQQNIEVLKTNVDITHQNVLQLNRQKEAKNTERTLIEISITEFQREYQAKLIVQDEAIEKSDFDSKEDILRALLSDEDKLRFTEIKRQHDKLTIELQTLHKKSAQDMSDHKSKKDFDDNEEDVIQQQSNIKHQKDDCLTRQGEISKSFELDHQIKERNAGIFKDIEIQEKELKKWNDLMKLLGGSKHAFNTYVQRLTLQNLIGFANIHLFKLNKRYSLKMNETYKPGEELNFRLIDHYQTDEARPVDTSSGGEKFLISLALALGLSDLASNNVNIDSLFIDEGFGTLDNHTLETVISTLETLQSQGKMIGIISHVDNLKERIPIQIQVIKKSNGISRVEIN